jgi:acetyl esterase/lipase
MRVLINLGGLVPLPADAMVTPVTFRIRKRHLRGILSEFDSAESGSRELQGEWIVGKRLWRLLQNEWRATQGVRPVPGEGFASVAKPQNTSGKGRVILFLHGGAYYCFSAATHRLITIPLSKYADARVFAVDYRLAPETRFPGPLHDAVSAYLRLVDDLHVPPSNILVAGDSAGGGMALALLMYLRDTRQPLPAAAILM